MRRVRLFLALIVLWSMPAFAAEKPVPPSAADGVAIYNVIQSQLAAFQKDDGAAAFAFATPELRQRFGTAETFMRMVRETYAPVYRPSQVTFGRLEASDGSIVQHVLVVGPDGNLHEALYFMERAAGGTWLIGGCLLVQSELKSS